MGRYVVTGGAGFIGSHLCDRLIAEGHTVLCVDNFLTGRASNIDHLASRATFRLIRHDITTPLEMKGPLDFVLHLASPASPVDYLRYPIQTLTAGSLGTLNMLELARAKGAAFFLASTSEVYGDPQVHPQPETYWGHVNPIGPRSVYDESKRFAEALTMAFHRAHGLETRIARIFNCYGPRLRLDDGRAIPTFIGQAFRGEPLTVFGTGQQTRSFCYIDDLIEGIVRLFRSDDSGPVNLGNPVECTILQLAQQIIELSGSRSQVIFQSLPQDDPRQRCPEIHLARERLGWQPTVTQVIGLKKTIAWLQEVLTSHAQSGDTSH